MHCYAIKTNVMIQSAWHASCDITRDTWHGTWHAFSDINIGGNSTAPVTGELRGVWELRGVCPPPGQSRPGLRLDTSSTVTLRSVRQTVCWCVILSSLVRQTVCWCEIWKKMWLSDSKGSKKKMFLQLFFILCLHWGWASSTWMWVVCCHIYDQ